MEALMEVSEGEWSQKDKETFLDKQSLLHRLSDTQSAATATTGSWKAIRQSIRDSEKQLWALQNLLPLSPPTVKTLDDLLGLRDIFPFKETPGDEPLAQNAFGMTVDRDGVYEDIYRSFVKREERFMKIARDKKLKSQVISAETPATAQKLDKGKDKAKDIPQEKTKVVGIKYKGTPGDIRAVSFF